MPANQQQGGGNGRLKIGASLQSALAALSELLLCDKDKIGSVRPAWRLAAGAPSRASIEKLAAVCCERLPKPSPAFAHKGWLRVMRCLGFDICAKALPLVVEGCSSAGKTETAERAAAIVISRAPPHRLQEALTAANGLAVSKPCLRALARKSPTAFAKIVNGNEKLVTENVHLIALWKAGPSGAIMRWLLPRTKQNLNGGMLLRAALSHLLKTGDKNSARMLLNEFVVTRGLNLSPQDLKRNCRKVKVAKVSGDREKALQTLVRELGI